MHTHIFYFFLFFYFIGLGPAQPIWAGLDPASPTRSLAQASEPAGSKHAWTWFMRAWHCAKVINYLRTVLNALKFSKKKWREKESLPCCRLLRWSVSVLGEDQWWRPLIGNLNSSFYLYFPALCFFFSRLWIFLMLCFSDPLYSLSVCFLVLVRESSFLVWEF